MKKIILAILVVMVMAPQSWAASSATMSLDASISDKRIVTISWIAHTDGTFTSVSTDSYYSSAGKTITQEIKGYYLYSVETDPGSTAPQDDYDITLTDANGLDIAGGLLANRDTTNTEMVNVGTASFGYPVIRGPLTVAISGNNVNSATGRIILILVK
jgi:hypothetical protein